MRTAGFARIPAHACLLCTRLARRSVLLRPLSLAARPSIRLADNAIYSGGEADTKTLAKEINVFADHVHTKYKLMQRAFRDFDLDKSGRLSPHELELALSHFNLGVPHAHVMQIALDLADKDGDGEIDYDEFCHLITKAEEAAKQSPQAATSVAPPPLLPPSLQSALSKVEVPVPPPSMLPPKQTPKPPAARPQGRAAADKGATSARRGRPARRTRVAKTATVVEPVAPKPRTKAELEEQFQRDHGTCSCYVGAALGQHLFERGRARAHSMRSHSRTCVPHDGSKGVGWKLAAPCNDDSPRTYHQTHPELTGLIDTLPRISKDPAPLRTHLRSCAQFWQPHSSRATAARPST